MCETTNVYEIFIKSNDTLFVLFITTIRTKVYLYRQSNCMEFYCISRMEQNKTEKNV